MNQKNFVIDILEDRGKQLLQNLDNKNWCLTRKYINNNYYELVLEEENNSKKE